MHSIFTSNLKLAFQTHQTASCSKFRLPRSCKYRPLLAEATCVFWCNPSHPSRCFLTPAQFVRVRLSFLPPHDFAMAAPSSFPQSQPLLFPNIYLLSLLPLQSSCHEALFGKERGGGCSCSAKEASQYAVQACICIAGGAVESSAHLEQLPRLQLFAVLCRGRRTLMQQSHLHHIAFTADIHWDTQEIFE